MKRYTQLEVAKLVNADSEMDLIEFLNDNLYNWTNENSIIWLTDDFHFIDFDVNVNQFNVELDAFNQAYDLDNVVYNHIVLHHDMGDTDPRKYLSEFGLDSQVMQNIEDCPMNAMDVRIWMIRHYNNKTVSDYFDNGQVFKTHGVAISIINSLTNNPYTLDHNEISRPSLFIVED